MDGQPGSSFPPPIRLLLAIAIATAIVVSLGWAVAWRDLNRLRRADYEDFERRIARLDSQLEDQLGTMRELLQEYAGSQDARIELESRLAAAETALARARADVLSFQGDDWEARFRGEQQRADELGATVAELEGKLALQEEAGAKLAAEARAAGKRQAELAAAQDEIDKLKRQLAHFTSQRQSPGAGDGDSYRRSRLQSLRAAMQGRSSGARIPILESVVPTIPGGVSAAELAELMAGMDSPDVRAAVVSLRPHLKAADADGQAALLELMQPEDAAAVADLLAGETAEAGK
jgi:hypothetical protein